MAIERVYSRAFVPGELHSQLRRNCFSFVAENINSNPICIWIIFSGDLSYDVGRPNDSHKHGGESRARAAVPVTEKTFSAARL